MADTKTLAPDELTNRCDPGIFPFRTTDEIHELEEVIGQTRALRAIDFGLGMENHGYNIYVLGETGTGRTSTLKSILEKKARNEPVPDDWCYVYNFSDADRPRALNLPPGRGCGLKQDMDELVEALKRDIPRVFESKDYEKHRDEIIEEQQEKTKGIFLKLEQLAKERGLVLKKTAAGLVVVPGKDGKPMSQEEYDALPRETRHAMEQEMKLLQDKLSDAIREARNIEKETKEKINALDREAVQYVVNPLVGELLDKYREFKGVVEYLEDAREDILNNIDDFRPKEEIALPLPGLKLPRPEPGFERYKVNVFVNNSSTEGAPVVFESNPTYYNLFGRIEYRVQYGVATTDFTMIKAGSIQRANGGYLVVNALDVLRNIFVYDAIKRMIKDGEVRIEDVWEQYRLVSTTTLKPEPIPVDIKVILIGEPFIYYLLYNRDSEYRKLFKVKADFDNVMPRNEENIHRYAQFVAKNCRSQNLLPFDAAGVARVVEYGSRFAGDKNKLTARFYAIQNLIVEASYWAKVEKSPTVGAEHVDKAYREMVYRNSKIEEKLREYIKEDTLMVTTTGTVVGQVNGIAVIDLGDYAFGKPSRITAKTYMGDSGVVNIEREVKMSGRIHNKALLILSSFLGERFAQDFPITLSASVCFEQLYEEIEGDSATCTEVYALLSSISGVPLKQGIAVTGSMNQRGEVQPVGGVNEKIEGFFDVCREKGLTGEQGVIIPRRNVKNLMLKKEVIDAVREGKFHIYPIDMVDEGLEILTSMPAGEKDENGIYPEGTVNRLVQDRLRKLARGYKEFGRAAAHKKAETKENKGNNNTPKNN